MAGLTMERAQELLHSTTTEAHLFEHAIGVSAAMGAMARHFGEDAAYWQAVGYLHDYDYEQYPEEHLKHTEEPLHAAGVDEESIRAILAHGYGLCSDVEPHTSKGIKPSKPQKSRTFPCTDWGKSYFLSGIYRFWVSPTAG